LTGSVLGQAGAVFGHSNSVLGQAGSVVWYSVTVIGQAEVDFGGFALANGKSIWDLVLYFTASPSSG
jgi:hypothetical protein